MTKTSRIDVCADCGEVLNESQETNKKNLCPKCGSIKRKTKVNIESTFEFHGQLRGKSKEEGIKKPVVEFISGDDLEKNSGKWHNKERIIDRESNLYKEVIKDKKTGKIIHECEEPLNEHFGHGSAKLKKDKKKNK